MVEFHQEARAEFIAAVAWYRLRNVDVANRFKAEVQRLVARIDNNPNQFPVIKDPIRIAIVAGFPYIVPFWIKSESIELLAVSHANRRPDYWEGRTE